MIGSSFHDPAGRLPAISVVLPVFNAEMFLAEALSSILGQSFADFECVAIDDGSRDASGAILESFAERDTRLRVLRRENRGLVATLNEGLQLARSPIVARMDADDVSFPDRLALQFEEFERRPGLTVLGGLTRIVSQAGEPIRLGHYPTGLEAVSRFIARGSPLAHPTVMMRKDAVLAVGAYRSAFNHAEDYDLWLRLHDAGYEIDNLPIPVLAYRQHQASVSVRFRQQQALATLVARMAHEARSAGFPDPTTTMTELTPACLQQFPASLLGSAAMEYFAVVHGSISLGSRDEILQAFETFKHFPSGERNSGSASWFLMRIGHGAARHGLLTTSALAFSLAFKNSPRLFMGASLDKLRELGPWRGHPDTGQK